MIVVEGLDGTGKTTLVEKIQQEFPELTYRPSIGNKHDLHQIEQQAYEEAYDDTNSKVLADRARLISEYVYNPVLQARPIAYDFKTWMKYLSAFVQRRQLIVWCQRELGNILEESDEDQLEGVWDNLHKLDYRYKQMMDMLQFLFELSPTPNNLIVDYNFEDHDSTDYIMEAVRIYLKGV